MKYNSLRKKNTYEKKENANNCEEYKITGKRKLL